MAVHLFDRFAGHEQVVLASDPATGLRAIVGIHSTALGPALGGTRFHPYADDAAALDDVLRLSRAMSYKNALAGLDLGGGKAVIIGDPRTDKTEALLEAYGRVVESLGGRYITACDVGHLRRRHGRRSPAPRRFVTGRSPEHGGSGDSSILTALGVFCGMRACAQHLWGSDDLTGRRVAISGVGKVGHRLVDHLRPRRGRPSSSTTSDAEAVGRVRGRPPRRRGGTDRGRARRLARRRHLLPERPGRRAGRRPPSNA